MIERTYIALTLVLTFFMMGCNGDPLPEPEPTGARKTIYYEGYEMDIQAIRNTYKLAKPPLQASSLKAIRAARRIFTKINFEGMTKEEVLSIIGDPATISDYGIPAQPGSDEPLIYNFDTGLFGSAYTLQFMEGKVVAVNTVLID